MKCLSALRAQLRACAKVAPLVAALYAVSVAAVAGADSKSEEAKPEPKAEKKAEKKVKAEKKKLTGSELYSIHCGRCHAERYPTEFTAAQWKTVVMEMRVRANLPAADAKAILKYLQEDSGTP